MLSNLKRRLKASFKNSLAQCNIKMIRKSTNRLSSLFRFIFVTPKELESHIVCKFCAVAAIILTMAELCAILT